MIVFNQASLSVVKVVLPPLTRWFPWNSDASAKLNRHSLKGQKPVITDLISVCLSVCVCVCVCVTHSDIAGGNIP